jgi:hypothetical protein
MLGYGFSISMNPFDHYAVGFRVPPDSPLAEARAWRAIELSKSNKKSKTDDSYRYYIFNAEHPRAQSGGFLETSIFSQDLLDSISILSANIRELQGHMFRSTGFILDRDPKGLTDRRKHRNLLHTLFQLRLECSNRSEVLRTNTAGSEDGSKDATSQKQKYAKLYRESQLAILETAAVLCRYCLLRAQAPHREVTDLLSSAAAAERIAETSEATRNVQKLLYRTNSATNGRSLFNSSGAVELLPANLAKKVRYVAEVLISGMVEKADSVMLQQQAISNKMLEKVRLTVLLAALREVHSKRSVGLPHQLKSWMKDMQRWYPFEDPFWNGPTEEFLPTLEGLMEAADGIIADETEPVMDAVWSDPRMLCWGWNVQEEEGLFSDTEELKVNGDSAACQPSKYLLCIPGVPESNGVAS